MISFEDSFVIHLNSVEPQPLQHAGAGRRRWRHGRSAVSSWEGAKVRETPRPCIHRRRITPPDDGSHSVDVYVHGWPTYFLNLI